MFQWRTLVPTLGFIYRAYQHVRKVALRNTKGMAFFGVLPNIIHSTPLGSCRDYGALGTRKFSQLPGYSWGTSLPSVTSSVGFTGLVTTVSSWVPFINPPFSSLVGWSQAAKMAAMREREEALEMKVLGCSWVPPTWGFGCELEYLQIEDTDEPLSLQSFVFVYILACRLLFFSCLIWRAHNIVNCFWVSFFFCLRNLAGH